MAKKIRADLFSHEELLYYQDHVIEFIDDWIFKPKSLKDGREYKLTSQQVQIIKAVWEFKRTTVRSGKSVGKTSALALVAIAFEVLFPEAKVFVTAPSMNTLTSVTMPEIKKWIVGSGVQDMFELTEQRAYLHEDKSGNSFIVARTASKNSPESMQGMHADNMLIIVDEASNVIDPIHRALDGTITGENNRIVLIGNSTRTTGVFFESHMNDSMGMYKKLKLSSEDSPLANKDNIRLLEMKWGRNHSIFRADVTAEFPDADSDTFMTMSQVEGAMSREVEPMGEIEIGVDVARQGDDKTALFWRHGMKVYEPIFRGKTTIPECNDLTLALVKDIRGKTGYTGVIKIKVDDTGVGGGLTDMLNLDRDNSIEVIPCNFGGKGTDYYQNEGSHMWGTLRDLIDRISLPSIVGAKNPEAMKDLREELVGRKVRYPNGKIMIEPKEEFKKNIKRSPDFADALVLLFFSKDVREPVIRSFDHLDKNMVARRFDYASGGSVYGSVFYTKDRRVSFVRGRWVAGTLYIEEEFFGDSNISSVASYILNSYLMGYKRIIGNNKCFSSASTNDIRGQMKKYGVRMRENSRYDELGAIELLNELSTQRRFKIFKKCDATIKQIAAWKMEGSNVSLEREYGLCYAVLNLVSELREEIEREVKGVTPRMEYSYNACNTNEYKTAQECHLEAFL